MGFRPGFRQWDLRTTRITPVWTGRTMLEDNSGVGNSMFLFYLQFL
jgi:hypothetical protein